MSVSGCMSSSVDSDVRAWIHELKMCRDFFPEATALRNKNQQRRVQMLDLFIYFIDVFATGDAVNDIETNFRWISFSLNSTCEIVVVDDLLCVMLSKYWSSTLARCSPADFG